MPVQRLSLGAVTGAHGVRGHFKVKPFTDKPDSLDAYGPVWLEDGRKLSLSVKSVSPKGFVLVSAREITNRESAEALRGSHLLIDRERLPSTDDDEHYHADLIGMVAATAEDGDLGDIVGIHDFGAGNIVEVKPMTGASFMLPFSGVNLVEVNAADRRVILSPPIGMVALVRAPKFQKPKRPKVERQQDD